MIAYLVKTLAVFPSADLHRDALRDPGSQHVPRRALPKVVDESIRNALDHLALLVLHFLPETRRAAGRDPATAEVADGVSVATCTSCGKAYTSTSGSRCYFGDCGFKDDLCLLCRHVRSDR